jgi:hypothetical protein
MPILSTASSSDVNEVLLDEMTAMRREMREMSGMARKEVAAMRKEMADKSEMARKEVAAMRKEMADKIDQMWET